MDFKAFVHYIISTLITPLFAIFFGATILFFLWNIMGVVKNSDNAEELEKFKSRAMWGIIAIAVMVSMVGLVNFFTGSIFPSGSNSPLRLDQFNRSTQ